MKGGCWSTWIYGSYTLSLSFSFSFSLSLDFTLHSTELGWVAQEMVCQNVEVVSRVKLVRTRR